MAETEGESSERRTFERLQTKIYGRFMLEDQSEHPCQVLDMSPASVALRTQHFGEPGERCICYIDHIGRVEGVVTRTLDDGFAMTLIASERKRDKIAAQLEWLANRKDTGAPEDRRHARVAPRNPITVMKLEDGRKYQCRIIDLSLSGAAVATDIRPAAGTMITLGTMKGRVVRQFDEGFAIEFVQTS